MANKLPLTYEDYVLMEQESFIREIEQSGIPLWVYHSYYYCCIPQVNTDNESQEFDDQILGL